jgi:hypothetical protein
MLKLRQESIKAILKSTSGTYHLGHSFAAACNSRSGIRMNAVNLATFEKASESVFCKKCFPNGKPKSVVEAS